MVENELPLEREIFFIRHFDDFQNRKKKKEKKNGKRGGNN